MCIFTGAITSVSATRILARMMASDRQVLVYDARLRTDADVAMILPVPVPSGAGEDAVRFIALDGYHELLDDVRLRLAKDYLSSTELNAQEIAELLGYTESTNFRRAFTRWTKTTPQKYRRAAQVVS